MRVPSSLLFAIILHSTVYSQVETAAMADEFKEVSKFSSHQTGFEGIQTYSSGTVNGSQFFNPAWANGTVTTVANETIGKNYLFIFDKVRQALFMKWKDSSFILLADKNQVKSFTINTDRTHYFIPCSTFDPAKKEGFFEMLVDGGTGYSLLKLVKTKFVKADNRDIEKVRLGEIYDSFEDETSFWISVNHTLPKAIKLKEWDIRKVLAAVKDKVGDYFTRHDQNTIDESFLAGLVLSINN